MNILQIILILLRLPRPDLDLVTRISGVEFRQDGGGNPFQHLLGEDSQQLPPDIQGLENRPRMLGRRSTVVELFTNLTDLMARDQVVLW
jgi:hypothetical protein